MNKTYKIEVDCANCANLMEDAARKIAGVQSATAVSYTHLDVYKRQHQAQGPRDGDLRKPEA